MKTENTGNKIIGISTHIQELRKKIKVLAKQEQTVLILGDTGTGKELVANNIHDSSERKGKPFITVNCAAIPADLLESQLFGHERGAFTEAKEQQIGKFESAHQGTILLDEIGDMRSDHQSKILRVLEENKIRRLGGVKDIPIDVRVIASTNKDLLSEIAEGNFRQDLYYRLTKEVIRLEPLSERPEDVIMLTNYFADKFKLVQRADPRAKFLFYAYNWPGNVRQLQNMVRHIDDFAYVKDELRRVWNSTAKQNSERNTTQHIGLLENESASEEDERDRFIKTIGFVENTGVDFKKGVEIYEIIMLNCYVSKLEISKALHLSKDKVFNFKDNYGYELDLKGDCYCVFHPLDVYPRPKTMRDSWPSLFSSIT